MTVIATQSSARQALEALGAAVNGLRSLDVTVLSGEELLDVVREVEVHKRRLATIDHVLVGEVDARGLAHERACRNTATLLSLLLRVDPSEAAGRVRAAVELGPRRALTGQPLPAVFAAVAAASAEGAISPVQARIVTRAIDALPADVQAERDVAIEAFLVEQARRFTPRELRTITTRLHATYDQDGQLASDTDRARRRCLDYRQHSDGTVTGRFHLDPIAGQALLSVLDPLAAPVPGPDGTRDPRTATQRRHDALRDALLHTLRTGRLPTSGGITTTIVLTMTLEQYTALHAPSRPGEYAARSRRHPPRGPNHTDPLVRTGHGALMHLSHARLLLGDAQLHPVVLDSIKAIHAYGTTHRLFTAAQRLAMAARDHGCSFPACTVPATWCEAHHITEHQDGGPTSTDNGTLLCGYHHRHFQHLGYTCTMINGIPHWTPPTWTDPTHTPIRNTAHHPDTHIP